MQGLNPQAEELNNIIKNYSETVYGLLSEKGKAIFFPKEGIIAQTAEAKGKRINATIGIALEEDGTPMRLKPIVKKVKLDPKDVFPYAHSFGKLELREKWKDMIYQKNPLLNRKEISLPIVTNALTHGLSVAGYLFIDKDDKIITPDLFWGNYNLIFINAYEAKLNTFRMFKNRGFDINSLRDKLKEEGVGKKILLLNFPNNPSGYTPTVDEVKDIVSAIKESAEQGNKMLVLIDDAYFGLVYKKGVYAQSIFSELADLHENVLAVKFDGATKEDYVWGLRVGFITYGIKNGNRELYNALEQKTGGVVRGNISNVPHISQSLVLSAFSSDNYLKEKNKKYKLLRKRFKEVDKVLMEHKEYEEEFSALPHNSGYFMCVELKNAEAEKVRQTLLSKYDTGVIAIGSLLRVAFSSLKTELIKELFENIYRACKEV